jgi:hypothetical protein
VRVAFGEGHELEGQLDEVVACYAVIRSPWGGVAEGVIVAVNLSTGVG